MMTDFQVDTRCIQWQKEAVNWREAIAVSAEPLVQNNYVADSYVEAMISNIDELGPYILIAPNVALPHARPENGVSRAGISLTVFQEPVPFPADSEGSVKTARVFICLAAVDSDSHLSMLQKISGWIDDSNLMKDLLHAGSEDEVKQLLTSSQN